MNEEEIQAKIKELEEREEAIKEREADAHAIGETIKGEYEKRLEAQRQEYERRLAARDEVIKQLAAGEQDAPARPSFIDAMNEKRANQNKKW